MSRPKVLLGVHTLPGHLNPMIGLAQQFSSAGFEVATFSEESVVDRMARAGVHVRAHVASRVTSTTSTLTVATASPRLALFNDPGWLTRYFKTAIVAPVERHVATLAPFLAELQPDVICTDPLLYAVAICAERSGVPWASVYTTFVPWVEDAWDCAYRRALESLHATLQQTAVRVGSSLALRIGHSVSPWLNPVYTIPELTSPSAVADDFAIHVGPSYPVGKRGDETEFPYERLRSDLPVVYVTSGTQFLFSERFYRTLFEAARPLGVQLVIAGPSPDEIFDSDAIVVRYAPSASVIARSAMVINHGGPASVMDCLVQGVPMLVVPLGHDQSWQGHFVSRCGAGRALDHDTASAAELRDAIRALIDPGAPERACALRLADTCRAMNGAARIVELLRSPARRAPCSVAAHVAAVHDRANGVIDGDAEPTLHRASESDEQRVSDDKKKRIFDLLFANLGFTAFTQLAEAAGCSEAYLEEFLVSEGPRLLKMGSIAARVRLASLKTQEASVELQRHDDRPLTAAADAIFLFTACRNESVRLPYFLDFYRRKGVASFFVVDNDSDDGTVEYLLEEPDVHVFSTKQSYAEFQYGIVWLNRLIAEFGVGRWCAVPDADELLVYPHSETVPLPSLATYLERSGATALCSMLLDMYPDTPVGAEVSYERGADPLACAAFFDVGNYDRTETKPWQWIGSSPREAILGGVRKRLFGAAPALQKIPFFKAAADTKLLESTHHVYGVRSGDVTSVLLHFKFLGDYGRRFRHEVLRAEHYKGASEYRLYEEALRGTGGIPFVCDRTRRYVDSAALEALGLLRSSSAFEAMVAGPRRVR